MFSLNRDERGFTLVELLIVISILGVLMAIVVPNVTGLLGYGKAQAFNSDKATIQTAVDAYFLANTLGNGKYPTASGAGPGVISFTLLVNTNLLRVVPQSAASASHPGGTGSYKWEIDASGTVSTTYTDGMYP